MAQQFVDYLLNGPLLESAGNDLLKELTKAILNRKIKFEGTTDLSRTLREVLDSDDDITSGKALKLILQIIQSGNYFETQYPELWGLTNKFLSRRLGRAVILYTGWAPVVGPVVGFLYGLVTAYDGGSYWSKLMRVFGLDSKIEDFVDDKKECIFLMKYIPSIKKKYVKNRPGKKKKIKESMFQLGLRVRKEAPIAFSRFLCEQYGIIVRNCEKKSTPVRK